MRGAEFFEAVGELDERYIGEAIAYDASGKSTPRFHRGRVAWAAAFLALFLIGAGVVNHVYGDSIQNWFRHYWKALTGQEMGAEQAAAIDGMSQKVGLSQTVHGVTVTVDSAAVGDQNFFLLLRAEGLSFSDQCSYGFGQITVEVEPKWKGDGTGGISFQYLGIDGDGAALWLVDYGYTGGGSSEWDSRPIQVSLTLENLLRDAHTDREELLAEGEWSYCFTLERGGEMEVVALPDTEVTAMDSNQMESVLVTLCSVELTATGLHFEYDDPGDTLTIDGGEIEVVLDSGERIGAGDGVGVRTEDGKTVSLSYQWLIPVNLDHVADVRIGDTLLTVPSD